LPGLSFARFPLGFGRGFVGGSGGTLPGLSFARFPLGFGRGLVGGSGGTLPGLSAETWTTASDWEGTVAGLAKAKVEVIKRTAIRTTRRTFNTFAVMVVLLLRVKLRTKRVTQLGGNIYNKSNPFVNYLIVTLSSII
jgi:hypothetical protein